MSDPTIPVQGVTPIDPQQPAQEQPLPKVVPAPKEALKEAADKFRQAGDLRDRAGQQLKQPTQFGHKMSVSVAPGQEPPRPQKPPVDARPLLNDRVMKQPHMRDSPAHRVVQEKAYPQQRTHFSSQEKLKILVQARNFPWEPQNKPVARELAREQVKEERARRGDSAQVRSERAEAKEHDGLVHQNRGFFDKLKQATSGFEGKVQEAVAGEETVPANADGKKGSFLMKTGEGWGKFFANMLKLGNTENPVARKMSELMEAIFRGIYKQAAQKGMTLVSDLHFTMEKKTAADKFARVLVDNPELMEMLEKLAPGDAIPEAFLKALGDEIQYLQLAHVPTGFGLTEEQGQANLAHMKNQGSAGAMAKMEQALLKERQQKLEEEKGRRHKGEEALAGGQGAFSGQQYDPRWEKQLRIDRPRSWILFLYLVGGIVASLLGFLLYRQLTL